jgi:hypothetical protein
VYNAGRNSGNDSIGFAPRDVGQGSGSSGLSSGAVAGISIGATLGGVALLAILFLWWRHKRAVRVDGVKIKDETGPHKIDPFTPTSSTHMFNRAAAGGEGRPYVIEQGPIGGEVGQTTGLLNSITPESSPRTTTMSSSHRRKAEEAGLLAAGGAAAGGAAALRVANDGRPQSSHTSTTSTEFIQNLPPQPITPGTPATPDAFTQQQQQQNPEAIVRQISSGSAFSPRASTSTGLGNVLSPTSPQIHYHIHLPPGAAATAAAANTFPPGSIIHAYENEHDEPAPEYSERPGTADTTNASTVQHDAPT